VCVALAFAACTSGKPELVFSVGGPPTELEFWQKAISRFKEKTGITVRLVRQPIDTDQRRQSILVPLKAEIKNPDIFLMDIAWIPQFAASGWLQDLRPYVEKDAFDMSVFWKNIIDSADTYNGKLIALPVYIDAGVFYYRKDLLKKYGESVPKYWEEVVKIGRKVQAKEREKNSKFYAFVWQGGQYEGLICDFLEFASLAGGGFNREGGRVIIDTPANRMTAAFMRDLIHEFKISPPNTYTDMKEEQVRRFFQSGNALFERNWPYAWGLHQSENSPVKGKVGIAPVPAFKGGKSFSTLGGWHLGISIYSDVKKEAWQFARFIVSYSFQKKLSLEMGYNPANREVYRDREVLSVFPHFKYLAEVFSKARARPVLPYYTQVSEIAHRYINAVLAAKIEPETAFKSAQKEINDMEERYQ